MGDGNDKLQSPACQNPPVPKRLPLIPDHAISRVDRRGIHGWRVHIKRRGEDHLALIHDHQHGGRQAARQAAQDWYLEALRQLPPPLRTSSKDVRSTTGHVGVSLQHLRRPSGAVYSSCRAIWPDGQGGYVRRSFSVKKHGHRRALALAVQARRLGLAQLAKRLRERLDVEIDKRSARRKR